MNTFKKLFSVTAIVALLSTIISPAMTVNASFSAELDGAYTFAADNGITSADSIDTANMYGSLTRIAMAKMMANFSMDVLGNEADTSMDCSFPDVSTTLDAQYDNGATNACQLGLMGVGITNFNPYGLVTRAEFGTVLSRALYGDANNGSDPYYAAHLDALLDAGIMNNISNPMMLEVRGYVMLMMMRAADEDTTEGCSAEELLACITAVDYDDCIAVCSDVEEEEEEEYTEEVSGDLTVDLASRQPSNDVPNNVVAVEVATLDFDAGNGDDVLLDSIELEATGYGDYNSIDEVAIYDDRGVKVSRQKDVNSDGEVKLNFINGYTIKAGGSEKLTITAKFDTSTSNGDTFGFDVVAVNGPEDVDGLSLSTQKVSIISINNMGEFKAEVDQVESSVKIGEEAVLIGGFNIKNDNKEEDLYVKSIKFEQIGTIDESYIEDVVIYADGQKVSDSDVLWDRDEVTIAFDNDGYLLSKDTSSFVEFDLRATITGEPTKTVGFRVLEESDIVVIGDRHGFRVAEVGTASLFPMVLSDVETTIDAAQVIVEGADILANFDKTEADAVVADKDGFLFGTLELESLETNYILNDYSIELLVTQAAGGRYNSGAITAVQNLAAAGISDVELGGDAYDTVTVTNGVNADETVFTFNFKDIDIDGNKTTNLQLAVDLDDATASDTFKFDLSLSDNSFELEDMDNDEKYVLVADVEDILSTTTFNTRTVTVEAGSLTVDQTTVNGQEVVIGNSSNMIAAIGKFIATDAEDILVKKFKITATTNVDDANTNALTLKDVVSSITLTVDGSDYDGDIVSDVVTFEDDFTVDAGETVNYEINLVMKDKDLLNNTGTISFDATQIVYRAGTADDSVDPLTNVLSTDYTVIENGTIAITLDTTEDDKEVYTQFTDTSKYVVGGAEGVILAKVKLNADKEDMKVKDIYFGLTGSVATNLTNIKDSILGLSLITEDGTYAGTLALSGDLVAKFDSVNFKVNEESIEYAYLVVDYSAINPLASTTATAGADVVVSLLTGNAEYVTDVIGLESDEDTGILTLGTSVSNTTTVVANVPTAVTIIEGGSVRGTDAVIARLQITMESQSVNKDAESEILEAMLSGINLGITPMGAGVTAANIRIVKGAVSSQAITNGSMSSVSNLGAKSIMDSADYFFDIVANTAVGTSDSPKLQVFISNIVTGLDILDMTGGVSTQLTLDPNATTSVSFIAE